MSSGGAICYIMHVKDELLLQLPCYSPLSVTTWVSQYQKKHSPTHTYPDHQSSFICFLHLLWSIASSLFNLRAWQVFLHNLCPSPLWSTSWSHTLHFILHTFLHPTIVFFLQYTACFAVVRRFYHLILVSLSLSGIFPAHFCRDSVEALQ